MIHVDKDMQKDRLTALAEMHEYRIVQKKITLACLFPRKFVYTSIHVNRNRHCWTAVVTAWTFLIMLP